MNTLITGGAGFIGSHLVDRLLHDGHRVTVLDNFSNGKWENLKQHKGNKRLKIVKVDIAGSDLDSMSFRATEGSRGISHKPTSINKPNSKFSITADERDPSTSLGMTGKIDWVFHLAALADIVPSIQRPLEYHRANVAGTVNVLEAARAAGVKRFLYAASSSCYGIPTKYPTPETAAIDPQYPYAFTKWVGEQYVLHWGKIYKLPVVSLRLFNVYGPRSRTSGTYGAVFGTFLAQKLAGKPFTVVGNGEQSRDFTFVTDVVDAFVKAAESNLSNAIYNVGTGKPQSVNRLVELLSESTNQPINQSTDQPIRRNKIRDVVYIPKRPGEPDKTQANIKKIQKELGCQPKVSFEEGVKILLKYINYWKKAPVWTPEKIRQETKEWFTYLS